MKIKDSEMCTFCKSQTETIRHLYWDCYYSKRLWERLKYWLKDTYDLPDEDTPRYYILGISEDNHYSDTFVYFTCILTKLYIHNCKYNETIPNTLDLKKYIMNTEQLERRTASGKHTGGW